MINKTVIKCPYCMSTNIREVAENATGDFGECYCSDCHREFKLYITSEEIDGVLTEVHTYNPDISKDIQEKRVEKECCCEKVGRSSEDYEREIDHLKHENARLFTAVENLNNTIKILIESIRKG